ncbi:MAG: DNA polymerase III subunit delta [Ruminococcaceae bacterium]|nr:DNA polymerase III subunit delta [Oscillospiraceae bacterium]
MAELNILKDADFRREIKSTPATGYLLFGEEDYLKNLAVTYARETLLGDPSFACFNEIILDALDFHPEKLRSALMCLPMMAERKVILLRGLDINAMRASELDGLCEVLSELEEYDYNTVLLPVASGNLDEGYLPKRPSATLNKLCASLRPVRYERCTPAKLLGWCIRHFEHNGATATPDVCQTLIDCCGRNMMTLASEIDKISFYVLSHDRTAVTAADIHTVACRSAEYDAFAFAGALMDRDTARALDILADFKFRRVEPLFILAEVIRTGCDMLSVLLLTREGKTPAEVASILKLHEYKVSLYRKSAATVGETAVRRMIAACNEADRALKLSPQGYAALEQLIGSL